MDDKDKDFFGAPPDIDGDGKVDYYDYYAERQLMDELESRKFLDEDDEDDDDDDWDFGDDDDGGDWDLGDEDDDEEEEGEQAAANDGVLTFNITFNVNSSGDGDTFETDGGYDFAKTERVAPDFIRRDIEAERRAGIEDMRFYCHWLPSCDSVLIVQGEIMAKSLKERFSLNAEIFDGEGDLIDIKSNFDYTGGAGVAIRDIVPKVFFNRYPFEFEFHPDDREIPVIHIKPEFDEQPAGENTESISSLDINGILSVAAPEGPIMVSRLDKGQKIPKSLVKYVIEGYTGLSDIKCAFFKDNKNESVYWRNQLTYTFILSGEVKIRSLLYFLFYNENNELVEWCVKDIPEGNYKNKAAKDFVNLPLNAKIGRIMVYVGAHPQDI